MYISPHGKAEGLGERLQKFSDQLATDRNIPFAGLGIIEDLRAAAALLEGRPLPKTSSAEELEYDL